MQKIYNDIKARYVWNFPALDLSYFEIPKTGSSSTKTFLFRACHGLPADDDLNIGGGQLARRFPDSVVRAPVADKLLGRILIIYRDPIARAKSAYRSIFIGRQRMQGPISEYLRDHLPDYLQSATSDGMLNHHKPMSWFFPAELIDDPRVQFFETSQLNTLPERLVPEHATMAQPEQMPHLLNVNKRIGEIDLTDAQIRAALGADFAADFALHDRLSVQATGQGAS